MTASRWPTPYREERSGGRREAGALPLLVAILGGRESLPDALCRDRAPEFDRDQLDGEDQATHADRLTAAVSVCQRCPEWSRCPAPIQRVQVHQVTRTS